MSKLLVRKMENGEERLFPLCMWSLNTQDKQEMICIGVLALFSMETYRVIIVKRTLRSRSFVSCQSRDCMQWTKQQSNQANKANFKSRCHCSCYVYLYIERYINPKYCLNDAIDTFISVLVKIKNRQYISVILLDQLKGIANNVKMYWAVYYTNWQQQGYSRMCRYYSRMSNSLYGYNTLICVFSCIFYLKYSHFNPEVWMKWLTTCWCGNCCCTRAHR